ncbi:hypothetical protein NC652_007537 [Populus alba x Populus x berolinensis]|nr:hypothetical protein NC652_007537 [Populus alba x Populus x berolinensis]
MERSSEVVYGKIGREETRGDFYGSAVGIFYEEGGGASAAAANAKLLPKENGGAEAKGAETQS